MPEGNTETPRAEPAGFVEKKKTSFARRIISKIGRVLKKPEGKWGASEKEKSPAGYLDMEKMQKLEEQRKKEERDRRISEQGCAVRSIMSAVACVTGRRDIYDDEDAWKAIVMPTDEEWDARLKQIDEGRKPVEELSDDLIKLYTEYAKNDSLLGNALKLVDITKNENQSEEQIKADILQGKQVLVFTPDMDPQLSHIFHAGLEKKRKGLKSKIACLSDPSWKKGKYPRAKNLSGKTYTTFSVILKTETPASTA